MSGDYLVIEFDHSFMSSRPDQLERLSELYCEIWEHDEHFSEYMKCSECGRYHSYEDVEIQGTDSCLDCEGELAKAWRPEEVSETILKDTLRRGFFGVVLIVDETIEGFSWGVLRTNNDMSAPYGELYDELLQGNPLASSCFYLYELGVSREQRGKGFGKALTRMVVRHAKENYPSATAALTTHPNSPSVGIYKKAGYRLLGNHPTSRNRVLFGAAKVSDLKTHLL